MRAFDADGRPVEHVIGTEKHPVVMVVLGREIERRPVVAARHRQRVFELVTGLVALVRVVKHRISANQRWTPAAAANARARIIAISRSGGDAPAPLRVSRLQRVVAAGPVGGRRAAEGEARRPGMPRFRRDENDALRRARSVNRARRGALQDLDGLDVVRVDVNRTVLLRGPIGRARDVLHVPRSGRHARIVHRYAVDHEQRLTRARQRARAPNPDIGGRARLTTGR